MNDWLLLEAFGRAYRCLRSVRLQAGRGEADDAAFLTRATQRASREPPLHRPSAACPGTATSAAPSSKWTRYLLYDRDSKLSGGYDIFRSGKVSLNSVGA